MRSVLKKKSFNRVLAVVMCVAMLMISAFATVTTVSAKAPKYTVSILQSVGGTASYFFNAEASPPTESVKLTATPDEGYKFDHWEIIGDYTLHRETLNDEICWLLITNDITVTACFVPDNNTANVKYSVEPTYMVSIPATVSLNSSTTISAENVVLEKGKQVEVAIASTSEDDNSFKLKSAEGAEIEYTIQNNNSDVNLNTNVLTVNPDTADTGSSTLKFTAPSNVTYAGSYTGTVTFNVAVNNA